MQFRFLLNYYKNQIFSLRLFSIIRDFIATNFLDLGHSSRVYRFFSFFLMIFELIVLFLRFIILLTIVFFTFFYGSCPRLTSGVLAILFSFLHFILFISFPYSVSSTANTDRPFLLGRNWISFRHLFVRFSVTLSCYAFPPHGIVTLKQTLKDFLRLICDKISC